MNRNSGRRFAGFSLIPWRYVRRLTAAPAELVHTVWRPAERAGELELIGYDGCYLDTGTPADYLAANLHAAAGAVLVEATATVTGPCEAAVIGARAVVAGAVTRGVVWPDARVATGEHLRDAVRIGDSLTVSCRRVRR